MSIQSKFRIMFYTPIVSHVFIYESEDARTAQDYYDDLENAQIFAIRVFSWSIPQQKWNEILDMNRAVDQIQSALQDYKKIHVLTDDEKIMLPHQLVINHQRML